MTKKQLLRLVSFLLVVCVLLTTLCGLFEYKNSHMTERLQTYKELEKDTVDVLYVGTSGVHCFWIAAQAYEDYGVTAYPLTADALPSWLVKNMVVEGLKYQSPELVVVDLRCFTWNPEGSFDTAERRSRRVIDMVDSFSLNRIDAIRTSLKVLNSVSDDVDELSFYLPFIKYHDLWSDDDFSFSELGAKGSDTLGYKMDNKKIIRKKTIKMPEKTDERALDDYNKKYLNSLIDYFEEEGINYLFVAEPRYLKADKYAAYNVIFDILDERKAPYVNYFDEETFNTTGLDLNKDFYDYGHVNFEGAKKYTDCFAKYLKDNYELPDRRQDKNCKQWDGVMEHINEKVDKMKKKK